MPTEPRVVPKNTLAFLFPQGFNEFWQKLEFKKDLELVIYHYIPASEDKEEVKKTLASGGYGWIAYAIIKHFFDRYQYSRFEPYEDVFLAKFKSNCIYAVSDIRKKEHLWSQTYREIDKLIKSIKSKETHTNSGVDKNNRHKRSTQTSQNILSQEIKDRRDDNFNLSGWDQKGTKLSIDRTQQDLAGIARLVSNYRITTINFLDYYKLFDKLMIKLFGCSVVQVIDSATGQRKWVSQAQYEELQEEETPKSKTPDGNEWDETLPYLERLKIYHAKNEKELKKLPDTSNRKPRINKRVECGQGLIPAYEKEINLPSAQLFLQRIRGEVAGYQKVIGYKEVIEVVARYLKGWEFYHKYKRRKPKQLMIGLLGDPGLGKTYIAQAIAKALGVGFHRVAMNGKKDSSIVYGTNIENPGAEIGEILKGISRNQNQFTEIFFDEIEKAGKEAKDSLGDPTDRTANKIFKDAFYDFPVDLSNIIYFCALNYPEELPDFIRDRFTMIEVTPPSYEARLEILRTLLIAEFKDLDNAFADIYGKNWEEIYNLFNQESLLKRALTKTMSIRGAKDNIENNLVPKLVDEFLEPQKSLPLDLVNFDWGFRPKEDLDLGDARRGRQPCPYALDTNRQAEHCTNCKCFVNNLDRVPGWRENMQEL